MSVKHGKKSPNSVAEVGKNKANGRPGGVPTKRFGGKTGCYATPKSFRPANKSMKLIQGGNKGDNGKMWLGNEPSQSWQQFRWCSAISWLSITRASQDDALLIPLMERSAEHTKYQLCSIRSIILTQFRGIACAITSGACFVVPKKLHQRVTQQKKHPALEFAIEHQVLPEMASNEQVLFHP